LPLLTKDLTKISKDDIIRLSERNNKMTNKITKEIKDRLEYLRGEIEAERISYGELAELQTLAEYIDPSDVLLLEWAGVEEKI